MYLCTDFFRGKPRLPRPHRAPYGILFCTWVFVFKLSSPKSISSICISIKSAWKYHSDGYCRNCIILFFFFGRYIYVYDLARKGISELSTTALIVYRSIIYCLPCATIPQNSECSIPITGEYRFTKVTLLICRHEDKFAAMAFHLYKFDLVF